MKNYLIVGLFFLLTTCTTEDDVGLEQSTTFVHYFNGGNNDEAKQIIQTSDNGFIILANTEIKVSELADPVYKIKLIKTDEFGNQQWQQFYPAFAGSDPVKTTDKSYKGNNLIALYDKADVNRKETGFAIVGEEIQNGSPKMMILKVDADGNWDEKNTKTKRTLKSVISLSGQGVSTNADGDFIVLGSIAGSPTNKNMILAKFDQATLDSVWSYQYGAGQTTLATRLFMNDQNDAFWGGTVQKDNTNSSIRFVRVLVDPSNLGGINFDLPLSNPQYTETGNDFCRYGAGFAIIGNTNQKDSGTGDTDILFKRISDDGTTLSSKSFPIAGQQQNENGNSIFATHDGGLILLGTIDTQGDIGRGDKDYYLIKIDAFGAVEWTKDYGSKFEDDGVNVIQAKDNGYVVLGTTSLGRVKTIMLMKTDKNGKIK